MLFLAMLVHDFSHVLLFLVLMVVLMIGSMDLKNDTHYYYSTDTKLQFSCFLIPQKYTLPTAVTLLLAKQSLKQVSMVL